MTDGRIALVATTIGEGRFVDEYVAASKAEGLEERVVLIIIPDRKTPRELFERCGRARATGAKIWCPSIEEQDEFLRRLGAIRSIIPYDSDNRRNIGFLMALEAGCEVVISIDDDNFPRPGSEFFREHLVVGRRVTLPAVHSEAGWYNICELLAVEPRNIYPRGFPYRHRRSAQTVCLRDEEGIVHINAGLWLGDPDVDAVTWLACEPRSNDFRGPSVLLGRTTWSPINTQNTAIAREALAAYYFIRMGQPLTGIMMDRDADIFSGYFVQACARHLGFYVRVGTPLTDHVRNSHDYLRDLTLELPCICILEDLTEWLREVRLEGSTYADAYLALAAALEEAVESFRGGVWCDATRAYFHYVAFCMRTWVKTVRLIAG